MTQAGTGSHSAARATIASATRSGSSVAFTARVTSTRASMRDRRLRSAACTGRSRLARSSRAGGDGERRLVGTRVPDRRRRRGCGMPDPSKSFYPHANIAWAGSGTEGGSDQFHPPAGGEVVALQPAALPAPPVIVVLQAADTAPLEPLEGAAAGRARTIFDVRDIGRQVN